MKKRILVALSAILVAVMLVATVSAASFGDVKEGDWFYDAVTYVSDNGLMNGTGDGNFAPSRILTRAEMAVMLYNLDKALYGESDVADAAPFTDVDAEWAKPAINWCYANGIITGSSATTFNPNGQLNRASMAVMFTRYIDSKGYTDVIDISRVDETVGSYTMFNDEFDWVNYDWYWDAVHYVGEVGLMGGKDSGNPDLPNFDPEGTASRAEAATVLTRLHKFLSIPTLGGERAWALFNADYACTVHGDVQFQYNKMGNMKGTTQATVAGQVQSYDFFMKEIDRVLDYNRDEYYLVLKNRDEYFSKVESSSTGASADAILSLVRWDGTAEVENTIEVFLEQRQWVNDNQLFPNSGIVIGNWACNDTEENYAEAIQAEIDRIFPEYMAYLKSSDGKIHMNYDATKDYGWTQWLQNPLNVAFFNTGLGNGFYHVGLLGQIDDARYMDDDGTKGEFWTEELQAGYDALLAKWNADETFEYTDTIILTTNTGKVNDENQWYTGMPAKTEEVTIVFHPVTDRTALMNAGEANVIIETDLKAEEITEFAFCEDCGKLHYICSDATITEESLLADFIDMNQVLFNKNKYVVTGLKLDDQFKTDLAALGNLEIASGKATFTFKDAYSLSKTLDVEIDLTIQKNTAITKAPDGNGKANKFTATLNVCPDEVGTFAAIELEQFIAENTCAECGVIHFNVNKASHAKMSKLQSAIISAMGQMKFERSVFVTTDNKTLLNNTLTDDAMKSLLEANGRITKDVTIVYAVSANNDVAMATVTLDIRLDSTYSTSIVPTQTLVNEISGEEFVTCPYNLETITSFEKSLIAAKVDKIVAEVGYDGVLCAWYGKGYNGEGSYGYRHGGFGWAQGTAHNLVLRHADWTDCARIYDPNEAEYGTFTQASYDAAIPNKANDAVADGQILVDNKTFVLEFKTKTTGEIFQKEIQITIGRNDAGEHHPYGSYAFIKDPASAMAEEKAAIQAVFDSFIAANATDGVVKLRIDGDTMWWTWMEGVTGRLILDNLINKYTEGALAPLVTAYVPDGYFVMGVMSQDDWAFLGKNMGEIPDGKVFEAREFTLSIRGAKSGIAQQYKITLQITQDSSFDDCVEVVK